MIYSLLQGAHYNPSHEEYTLLDGRGLTAQGIDQADLVTLKRYLEGVEQHQQPRPVEPMDSAFAFFFVGSTVQWSPRDKQFINRLGETRTDAEAGKAFRIENMAFMMDPGDICYEGGYLTWERDCIPNNTVVVWMAKRRYTYAAIKAGDNWYITGDGEFYHGNVFNHAQFRDGILAHSETSAARFAFNGRAIGCGPPF